MCFGPVVWWWKGGRRAEGAGCYGQRDAGSIRRKTNPRDRDWPKQTTPDTHFSRRRRPTPLWSEWIFLFPDWTFAYIHWRHPHLLWMIVDRPKTTHFPLRFGVCVCVTCKWGPVTVFRWGWAAIIIIASLPRMETTPDCVMWYCCVSGLRTRKQQKKFIFLSCCCAQNGNIPKWGVIIVIRRDGRVVLVVRRCIKAKNYRPEKVLVT